MAAATLIAVLGLDACAGGESENAVVVRVGQRAITKAAVDHWADVVERDGAFTGFRGAPHGGTARRRALALLISSEWLIGEAERRGLAASTGAVEAAISERAGARGEAALRRRLARNGQTISGLEFELRAELALEALLGELGERAERATHAEVLGYYRSHPTLFSSPEVRVVDIVENLPSPAAATALVRRVGIGSRFTKAAYHKHLAHTTGVLAGSKDKKEVDYAIFSARPGVMSKPMPLEGGWAVFVVRKVAPPVRQTFAAVKGDVVKYLRGSRPRELKAQLDSEFTERWRAKTSCRAGYVAPGCAQYRGSLGEYEDPFGTP